MPLPDEIVLTILEDVDAETLGGALRVSRSFRQLAGLPRLWQRHCTWAFGLTRPGQGPTEDWRQLYLRRKKVDARVQRLLSGVVGQCTQRIALVRQLETIGADAFDQLKAQMQVRDTSDYLSRNYHAHSCLLYLQRQQAVATLHRIATYGHLPLETGLGALSLFRGGFYEEMDHKLDELRDRFLYDNPIGPSTSLEEVSLLLCEFMEGEGYGRSDSFHYYDLDNSFLHTVLDVKYRTLPLTLVAIFCCLMHRLGYPDVHPINFPAHVVARVDSAPGPFFVDMFKDDADKIVPEAMLIDRLQALGLATDFHFLQPASVAEVVCRSARNILNSLQRNPPQPRTQFEGLYAALCALIILDNGHPERLCEALASVISSAYPFRLDVDFMTDVLLPRIEDEGTTRELKKAIAEMSRSDRDGPIPKKRAGFAHVTHRVGEVFLHKRYEYRGVIVGWTRECEATERWQTQMRIQDLDQGKTQPFYNVLDEEGNARYVAQENVIPAETSTCARFLQNPDIGRYFQRFESGTFVPSADLATEYPED